LEPENEAALQSLLANHFGVKVNSALEIAQGSGQSIAMRASINRVPDFISNYVSDHEKTLFGEDRGRVVGLVKAYETWNTGMRNDRPPEQVKYLRGLAHLHKVMRDHGCRYGFIMTEIELLCVRCGGPGESATEATANGEAEIPFFGYFEISAPISLQTHGMEDDGETPRMTAGLALWYLHMLAKQDPLPGQHSWRMEVGGPVALTRQKCLPKDDWIPKPTTLEKREVKRQRGWVFPEEKLSKSERKCGRK